MRYKPGHREEAKARILAAAGSGFRKHGYGGIGVDGLAEEAGVTSGAFYGHFASKESAFQEAIAVGLDQLRGSIERFRAQHGEGWVEAYTDFYLGPRRTCDLSDSCTLQSLSSEVGRSSEAIRSTYRAEIVKVVAAVAEGLSSGTLEERERRAWAFLVILSGGVTMARAVDDMAVGEAIAAAARVAALSAAATG